MGIDMLVLAKHAMYKPMVLYWAHLPTSENYSKTWQDLQHLLGKFSFRMAKGVECWSFLSFWKLAAQVK